MKLKTDSFSRMADEISSNNKRIIIFGAGVIGVTVLPEILDKYGLLDKIECFVDNDISKINSIVELRGVTVSILSPNILKEYNDKIVVLIAMSRFNNIFNQLEQLCGSTNKLCYFIPEMCIKNFRSTGNKGINADYETQVIPKKIHYMWLGGKPIPDNLVKCIDSWKKYCPDYEIIRWDETNYDVHKNEFMAQAYDNRKFGFVPDYARIELLYDYGGIYLDTDVELKRNLDDLLYQNAFCSVEKWQVLNWGGCSGAVKGFKTLEPFLEKWKNRKLLRTDGSIDNTSSGMIDTITAIDLGYKINGENQNVNGLNIYTYDYFHPYDYMTCKIDQTNDTFSIHHFNGGWLSEKSDIYEQSQAYAEFISHFDN